MIKLKIFALLCSFFLTFNLFASDYESKKSQNHIHKNLDYLHLTKEQQETIKELLISYRKKSSHYYEKKQKEEEKLQHLFQQEKFDDKEYEEIAEEIYEDAIELEIKTLKKIHAILNPKQRELFSYYLQEWKVE